MPSCAIACWPYSVSPTRMTMIEAFDILFIVAGRIADAQLCIGAVAFLALVNSDGGLR